MAWLYKQTGSENWWLGYRLNGKQFLKSTGTADKVEAQKQLEKFDLMMGANRAGILTLELFQQITGKVTPSQTLRAALDSWLLETSGSASAKTLEKYTNVSKEFAKHFNATERGPMMADLTRQQIQDFLTTKRAGVSAVTTNGTRKCLAVFFKRCQANDLLRDNPMLGIKTFKASKDEARVRRPFKLAEMVSLYGIAPSDFWRYMVVAGFYTGLRLGDLAMMPVGAVDLKTTTINILTRKTGAPMHIPIAPALLNILTARLAQIKGAKPVDPLWPEQSQGYEEKGSGWLSNQFYETLLVPAGLAQPRSHAPKKNKGPGIRRQQNEISFHCFRHSCVSMHAALGQNQQTVKGLVGHSSDQINDLYTKVPADVLAAAVKLLPDITTKEAK